ncbi:MAG: biotin carboxylase, partial [Gammaproteobacteria bacterium]
MKYNKKVFVIVDAYTTGRFLAPYLNANGYSCIHVQSREQVIPVYFATFNRENFVDNLIFRDNITEITRYLQFYDIKAIIPGAETGVMLADKLN